MAQREKRSVSLPPELARAVEEAARAEGTTFSAWLAQTAAHRLKLEAGRKALAEWERENGPLTEAELAEGRARARASLGRTSADPPSASPRNRSGQGYLRYRRAGGGRTKQPSHVDVACGLPG